MSEQRREPVAIVGVACRLPGAPDPAAFWQLLHDGRAAVRDVPENHPLAGTGVTRRAGYLERSDLFDAGFFGVSPREADAMDPQQRLALELAWEALEDARIIPDTVRGSAAGVIIGAAHDDYATLLHRLDPGAVTHQTLTGIHRGILANRLSYTLGLRGPSLSLDSAQSSSLVAVHLAAECLRAGDSDLVLVGGVNLMVAPDSTLLVERLGALSPDDTSYTFDARANGYVRGEGGAMLVLKRLDRARADGDRVRAVILGSAVNNDGGGANLTSPDGRAQERVIRVAHARAGTAPGDVQYVELHGTGTPVGDPIEAAAVGAALGVGRDAPLRVGSVKTNVGHLEGAAGIVGLLKTVLAVEHRELPASLHHEVPHPDIPLHALGLAVQRAAEPWPRPDGTLIAGVNSWGMGGTNCHVVVSSAPAPAPAPAPASLPEDAGPPPSPVTGLTPLAVSGVGADGLAAQAARLVDVLAAGVPVADVGLSLARSRTAFRSRAVVLGPAVAGLASVAAGDVDADVVRGTVTTSGRGPVFVFPGQGAQWVGMGRELMTASPVFARAIRQCADALAAFVDWSLLEIIEGAGPLDRVDVVQPSSWAMMVSLARLWQSCGVGPAAVLGHSQGEIAAAVVAGRLSLVDGARVVALRSRAIRRIAGRGGMMTVALAPEQLASLPVDRLSIAAVNAPGSVVVAGPLDALDALQARCDAEGVRARRVAVDYASHSPDVATIEADITAALADLAPAPGDVPFFSSVEAGYVDGVPLDGAYWYRNLRQRVRFAESVETLARDGFDTFIEISPHPVLSLAVQQTAEDAAVIGTLKRDDGGARRFATSLAEAYVRGVPVDWAVFHPQASLVDLPTYAFRRRRHWLHGSARPQAVAAVAATAVAATADAEPAAPDLDLLPRVRAHAAAVLGHPAAADVDVHLTFKTLGFDSATTVELRNRLLADTGLRLSTSALFDHPTPAALAGHLDALRRGGHDRQTSRTGAAVHDEPIAIVGMSCRLPGDVDTPEAFWRFLVDGADAVSTFPTDRGWDLDALYDPDPEHPGTTYTRAGAFLRGAAGFDPVFFGISPREAAAMDPQQRLLLETSWEALERAGIDPARLRETDTGVFVGLIPQEYGPKLHQAPEGVGGYLLTGTFGSVASGRIAYTLGLRGPAMTVDTACSSSLVALHLAAQSLRAGECSLALAGGATVMSGPGMFVEFSRQRGLAADGRCKPFAACADGTGWGEGVGVLLLERLRDAHRNGHRVLAVVRGTAVNSDGASNGLSAPNGLAQERVIRAALAAAGLEPSDVDAVEAHGTGTRLGDPIEAQALLATYGQDRAEPLWLGSVKSNIGHAQAAAGVAGVIKMVLAIQHGELPRTLHVDEPSGFVDWTAGAVALLTDHRPWPATGRPRRAGVSSFGISGTNAHVILEEAPETPPTAPESRRGPFAAGAPRPLVVTGVGDAGLAAHAEAVAALIESGADPADVGYSLARSRGALRARAVVLGDPVPGLRSLSGSTLSGDGAAGGAVAGSTSAGDPAGGAVAGVVRGEAGGTGRGVVFVFPGQGAQWVGMGRELLETSPVFAESMRQCAEALSPFVDWSLLDVLRDGDPLDRVDVVQPASWAMMVSLARLWQACGVRPAAVVGHSQGEIAAAVVAGGLSLADGARVVALRSRAIRRIAGMGGMMSVSLPLTRVEELVAGTAVSIAAVNGPGSVVVSGPVEALDTLRVRCEADGVRARRVAVDYASHSPDVAAIEAELAEALAGVTGRSGGIAMHSTLEGGVVDGAVLDGAYWYRNLRHRVRFEEAVRGLGDAGYDIFVEVSPHPVLTLPVQQTLEHATVLGTLRRDDGAARRFLTSLAEAFVAGVPVDWAVLHPDAALIDLPTYPFQRQRYWLAEPDAAPVAADPADAAFWDAVERGDLAALGRDLRLPDERALGEVLPALAGWRRERLARATVDSWRYTVTWEESPSRAAPAGGAWLLVVPDGEERLADAVATVLDTVRVTGPADLPADCGPYAGILSLLALDERPHPALTAGTAATVELVQALLRRAARAPLWCLTRGAVATVPGTGPAHPLQAAVWGLGRVAALEHPRLWGGLLDLDGTDDLTGLAEALGAGDGEDQVALRAGRRFVRRLTGTPLHAVAPVRGWRPEGTVLVTGGTGALGAHVARWLAAGGATDIVLTGRRGADAPGVAAVASGLEAAGVRVDVRACDVGDRAAVDALAGALRAEGRTVGTVIHAAGVGRLGPIERVTVADVAESVAGKVRGVEHLVDAFAPSSMVLFSSISGVWGVADHAAYAAANAALDALAEHHRERGVPVLSVAWGPWDGGGMIPAELREPLRRRGIPVIPPEPALAALQQVLDRDDTAVALADVDWARFVPVFTGERPSPLIAGLEPTAATAAAGGRQPDADGRPALVRRLAGLPRAEQDRILFDLVRREAATVLGYGSPEAISPGRAFKDLGFDSVTAVELRNRLKAGTGLALATTLVFDHPNPRALAAHLRTAALGADGVAAVAAAGQDGGGDDDDPIAIVAMGCRYPGGIHSPEALWEAVAAGTDVISDLPTDRGWDLARIYHADPDHPGTSYVRRGGFLYDAADFDAAFFGISPREAAAMDPQQRLLLETAWETIERAGIDPASLRGSDVGVVTGITDQAYGSRLRGGPEGTEGYLVTGASTAVATGRISYLLGLQGPALTVDTACSSSLVAVHLAGGLLRERQSSMVLACAAMVMSDPSPLVGFSRQRALAPDGRCKPFAQAADGFALAEGVGVLLLERLSDARRNGHPVLALVRGSAINSDGASNGLTAPSGPAQQRVIAAALADAGLRPADVDAVEAHGTGTRLGDPIEAQALINAYGQERPADRPLLIGSVKSNLGHTQTASGMAGVIKMVFAMRHGWLPRTLHVDEPSSYVDWSAGAVRLLTEDAAWPQTGRVRRCGVSAFGISGTNAHVVLEQEPPAAQPRVAEPSVAEPPVAGPTVAQPPVAEPPLRGVTPWVLSGNGAEALREQAERLAAVDAHPADIGLSLVRTRTLHDTRAVVLGGDGLGAVVGGVESADVVRGTAGGSGRGVVFVFPGQGAQWVGMGRELLEVSPVFAGWMGRCGEALSSFVDWSLLDVVRGGGDLDRVDVVQPVSWAVMVSLAQLWRSCGVEPAVVLGHSQGEIAAAVVGGWLSLEDGARVVALRSRAIRGIAGGGGMLSVGLSVGEVEGVCGGDVWVAAVNGPRSVVVAGGVEALDGLQARWEAGGVWVRRVAVDYASHTPFVEAIEGEIVGALGGVVPLVGRVPFFSSVDVGFVGGGLDGGYWYRNLRERVRFGDAVVGLGGEGFDVFVEVSPHPVLSMAVQESLGDAVVVGSLRRGDGGRRRFVTSLAEAFVRGVSVDWGVFFPGASVVDLPTYAFQHKRYWLDAPDAAPAAVDEAEAAFWDAVERGDLAALSRTVDGATDGATDGGADALAVALPVLANWRRNRRAGATLDSWRYEVTWTPVHRSGAGALPATWLVIAPPTDDPRLLELDGRLRAGGVHEDAGGAGSGRNGSTGRRVASVVFDPGRDDRATLADRLRAAAATAGHLDAVLSLVPLGRPAGDSGHPGVPGTVMAAITLVQALRDAGLECPLWTATGSLADPDQAAVWGLMRVFGLDHPTRWGGLVELPDTPDGEAWQRFFTALTGPDDEDQFAVRAEGLLAPRLARKPVEACGPARPVVLSGTTVITGGTGALGAHLARDLAAAGAEHLLLLSRRGPRATGAAELEAELTGLGARVTIASCDVGDRDSLAAVLAAVPGDLPVTAVVHAAGTEPPEADLHDTGWDAVASVTSAKILGAEHLDSLLADRDLAAFVLFSSGAGIWGDGGHGAYAAANAYLDALAARRRAAGRVATSIAWGAWAGGGMIGEAQGGKLSRYGVSTMDPALAASAVRQAIAHDETQLVVADLDWGRLAPAYSASRRRRLFDEIPEARRAVSPDGTAAAADEPAGLDRQLAGRSPEEQRQMILQIVRTQAAAVLGHASAASISANHAFRDLGFDSLTAVELRNRLRGATGLSLPATLVFDHPTPTALARWLHERIEPRRDGGAGIPGLDELESAVAALPPDDAARSRVAARLQAMLWRLGGAVERPTAAQDDEVLDAVTDEEMYELIDRELGRS